MKRIYLVFLIVLIAFPVVVSAQTGPWVITTDYGVFGRIESFNPVSPWTASGELAVIPGDATGRHYNDLLYVVGRGGSNLIQIYNPSASFELISEFSIGAGRNPQDIAFDQQGMAFVSCYDEAVLLLVDTQEAEVIQTFTTEFIADSDGLPETGWMRVHHNDLYINCQLLDRGNWYAPTGPGQLLVMDLNTLQWRDPVELLGANPYTKIRVHNDDSLLVGCVGFWGILDGGIEKVNPNSGLSEGFLITEEELGGDVVNFVVEDDQLFVLISNASFVTSIVSVNLNTHAVTTVVSGTGYNLADLAWDGDFQLYVADRDLNSTGIRVFDSVTHVELTTHSVGTGLPPFQFVMPVRADVSALPDGGASLGRLNMGLPFPNPCNPAADLVITTDANSLVNVSVFDLRGHRVQQKSIKTGSTGRASYRFDGHDSAGAALSAGMYRIVAQSRAGFAARSVTLVK